MGINLDRGGRDDTRQRRALQRLVTDPSGAIAAGTAVLKSDGGLEYVAGELTIKIDGPGLDLSAAGLAFDPTEVKLDDFATPDDNTDLNATTGRHGLLLKLSGVVTQFLNGTGTWTTPGGSSIPGVEIEFDFGSSNVNEATFTITDANIGVSSEVFIQHINKAATGRDLDENEFANFEAAATVTGAGSASVRIVAIDGRVSGPYKFVYIIVN